MIENIRVALNGLGANKLRSALTMLGITIGVAAVIVLVSLGQAVENFILGEFSNIGTNLVFVGGETDGFERPQPLTEAELRALQDPFRVPDALYVAPAIDIAPGNALVSTVVYEDQNTQARVIGITPEYAIMLSREAIVGRMLDQEDIVGAARVAVVGLKVVQNLFDGQDPVGREIRVNNVGLTVIGVLNEKGGGSFGPGSDQDNFIFVPYTTAHERLIRSQTNSGERLAGQIAIQARDEESIDAVVRQVRQTLREERAINFRDEDTFVILTQDELLASLGSITSLLTVFLGVIAGISLLVGGIGIMNIMLVTVTERTREIGLRKAVGAKRGDILFQFLIEAVVLALIGGGIGISIATGFSALVSASVPDLEVSVQASSVFLATMISVLIGVFFGIYPADRAAKLNPIDALRYE